MKFNKVYLFGAMRTIKVTPNWDYTQNPTNKAVKLAAEACIKLQLRSKT